MDWESYKRLADTPGIWSRWMLEQIMELLEHPHPELQDAAAAGIRDRILCCLGHSPIPKPDGHKGGPAADMFRLDLDTPQARALLAMLDHAVRLGVTTSGTRGRGLGGFVEAWQEYLDLIS